MLDKMSEDGKLKNFVEWTKLKMRIHVSDRIIYFKEREIWWISLGCNIGHEEDGKNIMFERPVLVLKKFSHHLLWVLPLTSQNKIGKYYHVCHYEGKEYSAILSQLRLISSKRLLRKVRTLPKNEFKEIREKIKCFL